MINFRELKEYKKLIQWTEETSDYSLACVEVNIRSQEQFINTLINENFKCAVLDFKNENEYDFSAALNAFKENYGEDVIPIIVNLQNKISILDEEDLKSLAFKINMSREVMINYCKPIIIIVQSEIMDAILKYAHDFSSTIDFRADFSDMIDKENFAFNDMHRSLLDSIYISNYPVKSKWEVYYGIVNSNYYSVDKRIKASENLIRTMIIYMMIDEWTEVEKKVLDFISSIEDKDSYLDIILNIDFYRMLFYSNIGKKEKSKEIAENFKRKYDNEKLNEKNIVNISIYLSEYYFKNSEYENALIYIENALEFFKGEYIRELAILYSLKGNVYIARGEFKSALENFEEALKLIEDKNYGDTNEKAYVYDCMANIYVLIEEYKKAFDYTQKSFRIRKQIFGENHLQVSRNYNDIAIIYYKLGEYKKSLEYDEKSLEIRRKILGEKHPDTAVSYNNIASIYRRLGEYKKSLEYNEKSLKISEEIFGIKHSSTACSYNNIGVVYLDLGEYEKSLEYNEKTLEINKELLGEKHPNTATSYNNIAEVYGKLREYKKSLEYIEKALEIDKEVLGEKHPNTSTCYNNIAAIYVELREYKKSLYYYKKSLEISNEVLGEKHPDTATRYNNIAEAYRKLGEYEKSIEYNEKALEIRKGVLGEKHPDVAQSYNNIGGAYRNLREYKKSQEYFKKSLKIRLEVLGEKHPDTAKVYFNISLNYRDENNYKEYLENITMAYLIYIKIFGVSHEKTKESLKALKEALILNKKNIPCEKWLKIFRDKNKI